MIENAVISKELVSVLRSRTARVLTLVSVGALSLLALSMWPAAGVNPSEVLYSRLFMGYDVDAGVSRPNVIRDLCSHQLLSFCHFW